MAFMYRVGAGSDLHRLVAGRPLVLGGVTVPHAKGPDAHSDGDVVLHATVDAILGASGLGDIGELFPDNDPQYKGMASTFFVRKAMELLGRSGWRLVNIDVTIHAQSPKLSPYKLQIRQRLSETLGMSADRVNVKAKTGERVGPVGREEAIAADAIVLIERGTPRD